MATLDQIDKEKQIIICCERSLALEKLKKRRADTRNKIELGGLVIKSKLNVYNKSIILGALTCSLQIMEADSNFIKIFETIGESLFDKN
ncbi:TPA: conjugal transfer protein TraD [Legionella pneumophila]|nr:conjugal transfer protein TraD [Legionella pneumophila]HAU1546684.1 conjugal transfer protein TraD [Legionella pneumophila]